VTIKEMQAGAFQNSLDHGFWDACRLGDRVDPLDAERVLLSIPMIFDADRVIKSIPEKVALLHSECSEVLEIYRERGAYGAADNLYDAPPKMLDSAPALPKKPYGIREELADILIRCGDLAGALGIDLERAVKEKMAYNATRPFKHGKNC